MKQAVLSKDKNQITFIPVYNLYKNKVFNYILKMTNDRFVAEDILQDVFVSFFNNLDKIRDNSSVSFWLFKTARNRVIEIYRKNKREQANDYEDEIISDSGTPAAQMEKKERSYILKAEIDNLPVEQKNVILLKEFSGLSYKEIAVIEDISEDLVKSRLYNARKKLLINLKPIIGK